MLLSSKPLSFPWQTVLALFITLSAFLFALWKLYQVDPKHKKPKHERRRLRLKMFTLWWTALVVTMLGLVFGVSPFIEENLSNGAIHLHPHKQQHVFAFLAFGLGTLLVTLLFPPPSTQKELESHPKNVNTYFPIATIFGFFLIIVSVFHTIRLSKCQNASTENNVGVTTIMMLTGFALVCPSVVSISVPSP